MDTINWGMIGVGDVSEKRNGQAFNNVGNSRLLAVMSRNEEKTKDYAQRHNIEYWYTDAKKLFNNNKLNAIYIGTPPSSHMAYALEALEKGFDVYLEKPVALNAVQALQIKDSLDKRPGQKLTVAHYRRELPLFKKVKELIEHNVIGDIRTVQIRTWQSKDYANDSDWYIDPELSGGGYFHAVAPHQIDLMLHFFGNPKDYNGFSLNQSGFGKADDHVCGQILFENNIVVNGSWCFTVAENQTTDTCELIGTKGKITFPFSGNYIKCINNEGDNDFIIDPPKYAQQPFIEKVVSYFRNDGSNPCSIEEAIISMSIMDTFTKK